MLTISDKVWVAGIDGCRGGWLMVRRRLGGGDAEVCLSPRFDELPAAALACIDMPIGLPDSGRRGADVEARALLGPRRNSVFLGFRRPLLAFEDYAAANGWAKADGAGLSKQAWNLLPKIRELDTLITPAIQDRLRETHPELAFLAMTGTPMPLPKHDPMGLLQRHEAVTAAGFAEIDRWLTALDRRKAKPDDLLDACALCHSAARIARGEGRRVPDDPPRDARGLRMEIWF